MRVFTHYPALAPAIQRAGFEPVLLEPLEFPPGPVKMVKVLDGAGQDVLMVAHPACPLITFRNSRDGWEVLP